MVNFSAVCGCCTRTDIVREHLEQAFSQGPKRGRPILAHQYIDSKGAGGGGEKTFLWKTFEVYVTSYQYLFQARSKFFKHTAMLLYLSTTFSFSQVHHQIDQMYNNNEN